MYGKPKLTYDILLEGMKRYAETKGSGKRMNANILMLCMREGLGEMPRLEFTDEEFRYMFREVIENDPDFYINELDPDIFFYRGKHEKRGEQTPTPP
jgi:hypothetical protein